MTVQVHVMRRVNHPNIIKYYSSFMESKSLYIVMEYADGGETSPCIPNVNPVQAISKSSSPLINGFESPFRSTSFGRFCSSSLS